MDPWVYLAIAAIAALAVATRRKPRQGTRRTTPSDTRRPYPGDFTGKVRLKYAPRDDGSPDPGEVVWTWVPFQEDPAQGKDRPVLIIGMDGTWLLGLMLTSKDHDHDARGRERWMDIGTGPWDRQRRPSEVRLDRIIRVDRRAVRREGAAVPRATFDAVARSLSALHNW
jgi:hypothetical protein